ncbi:MAG TPA: 3-isopropylmalate dehydratase small subunit [Acidobacteriota bacterium]|nr:3-isopropylmalate dehydratase small subunit [Acidobacteriota bacterium]HQM62491.1 3-isopropylmalate dehydratase small subunit [Acidobacteriota bacterium]
MNDPVRAMVRSVFPSPLASRFLVLPVDHVDTDQIMPARFLTAVGKDGFGARLFHDWRYDAAGNPRADCVFNRPDAAGAAVLVSGENFGCGSSREHAAWALAQFGFRAVVCPSFADIFRQNALQNDLLPVVVPGDFHHRLVEWTKYDPDAHLTIDLVARTVIAPNGQAVEFPLDSFSQIRLLEGLDEIQFILRHGADIEAFECGRPGCVVQVVNPPDSMTAR